jgi:hypothetical protein
MSVNEEKNIKRLKMNTLKIRLGKALPPVYEELLRNNSFGNICTFCVQWGENFPENFPEKDGMLFVGKAVNGWMTNNTHVNVLFGKTNEGVFARDDQMEWVKNLEGKNEAGYNTKKSAFWRVAKNISARFYPDEWQSNVAWSNLYKLAPYTGGNPDAGLRNEQNSVCQRIFEKEIEILSPKYVILFTSGWENDFLKYLNGNKTPQSLQTIAWDGYETKLFQIKDTYFVASQHPQGKNEAEHGKAIINLLTK